MHVRNHTLSLNKTCIAKYCLPHTSPISKQPLIVIICWFIVACIRFSGGDPTEPTTHITTPHHTTEHHTTEHHTTAQHTTAQHTTTQQTYPTGATPTATPSPGGGSHTVTVILVVLAILAILAGLAAAGFVAYKRKLQIPGMDRIQGFINPNYRRMAEDSNIVSLIFLSICSS